MLRSERLVEADDLDAAVVAMDEAFALGEEHELELPPGLRFEYARVSFAVGFLEAAKASVTKYLTSAGQKGEFYEAALALLEDVEQILEQRDAPECSPEPEGTACWMELTSHPGCYVMWDHSFLSIAEAATWTGECSAGFAQGPGTVTWTYGDGEQQNEGNRRYGQPHGESVMADGAGSVFAGPFRFGKPHGDWVWRLSTGDVWQGPYVDGEQNGHWVVRFADGDVWEGPYVDDHRHGHWVFRDADGDVREGPYVNGKRHGHWVWRFGGAVWEGPYVDGEWNGHWVQRNADGDVGEGPYVGGVRNGHWVQRFANGSTGEGPFVDGKRHGRWTWTYPSGQVESGPYVDGEKHGRWRVRPPNGDTYYIEFLRGIRQKP